MNNKVEYKNKKIALFSAPCKYIDDVLALVKENKYVEWDLNTIPFSLSTKRMGYVREFIENNGEVRFHLPYGFWDLGIDDDEIFNDSFNYYCRLFKTIESLGASVAVLHIGAAAGSDIQTSLKGLKKLVQVAEKYNIKLCIENLIHGLSSNMDFIKQCLDIEGVYFCLDTGHAECLRRKNGNEIYEKILSVKDKILHAHVYDVEDENMNHVPFTEETISNNLWLPLLQSSNCLWYTMELDYKIDQDNQIRLIKKYLNI